MGDNTAKTKSAMLNELESIKGLLLEDDDIPILQEIIEQEPEMPAEITASSAVKSQPETSSAARVIVEQQQDFFSSIQDADTAEELLDSLDDLETKTSRITAQKTTFDSSKTHRASLAKPMGENPFLPQHIRERLHGNNPPPLFASETARKIATTSKPMTQLGNTQPRFSSARPTNSQQELIDSIVAKVLPEIEQELRQRLESMSRTMLDELNR